MGGGSNPIGTTGGGHGFAATSDGGHGLTATSGGGMNPRRLSRQTQDPNPRRMSRQTHNPRRMSQRTQNPNPRRLSRRTHNPTPAGCRGEPRTPAFPFPSDNFHCEILTATFVAFIIKPNLSTPGSIPVPPTGNPWL